MGTDCQGVWKILRPLGIIFFNELSVVQSILWGKMQTLVATEGKRSCLTDLVRSGLENLSQGELG